MKMQVKLMMLLITLFPVLFIGCKKHDCQGRATTIIGWNKEQVKAEPETLKGTFTANGGLVTSGSTLMIVEPVGSDSIHCTTTLTAQEGSFLMIMDCSTTTMTGRWDIPSGTGTYASLRGSGTLVMTFPPDVPKNVLSVETMTGVTMIND